MKTRHSLLSLSLLFAGALAHTASANLVANGNFDTVTYTPAAGDTTHPLTTVFGQFGTGSGVTLTVANWSTTGYNFVFAPGTADSGTRNAGANSGQPNQAPGQANATNGYGGLYLAGPKNGSNNGLTDTSPAGGNFVAADGGLPTGSPVTAPITQSISGLNSGQNYALSFYWGAAQQQGFGSSATGDVWQVSLGSQTFTTPGVNIGGAGFSGWMQQTFTFTATAATETLSFLAQGPQGAPPFLLLDGVDLEVVPEFSHWGVFAGFGLACIIFESFRRRRRVPATS